MCACTMCVRVNARVGEGMVGELHVGGVCAACEVYGLIVVCAGAGSTMCVGDVCAGDACIVFISLLNVLFTFENRGISSSFRYRSESCWLYYKK